MAETLLLGVVFFIATFTRSVVIQNNDLGWRAWLPGQFVLLVWGVDILSRLNIFSKERSTLPPKTQHNLIVLVALGIATTILNLFLLRFSFYLVNGAETGYRIYSARQTYAAINQTMPEDAVIQYNPLSYINRPSGLYGMHQSAISDRTAYGVPLDVYNAKVEAISEIFLMQNVQDWHPLDTLCKTHFIDVIVITNGDPIWESLILLEQHRKPIYADAYYAAFACGDYAVSSRAP